MTSLLSYYQDNQFNPVPIALNNSAQWQSHAAKRRNLYQNHLGIPLGMFAGKDVLEFGCNSGENALVLASAGARMTLVEPNEQVLPRLRALFQEYGQEQQIAQLLNVGVDAFQSDQQYDVVLAEGFLYALANRDQALQTVCKWIKRGGVGVMSFNDRYGFFVEFIKQLVLRRLCELQNDLAFDSAESLALAQRLFGADFAKLNASRPFEAWWKDTIVNPFLGFAYLWSYQELLPIIAAAGCEAYNTSPVWSTVEHYNWYKNTRDPQTRHQLFFENWAAVFPYILTGLAGVYPSAPMEVVGAVHDFMQTGSAYVFGASEKFAAIPFPAMLESYLMGIDDAHIRRFSADLQQILVVLRGNSAEEIISTYEKAAFLRGVWGTPYHYLSFSKAF